MEIKPYSEPLYAPPAPHYTREFKDYFTLRRETFAQPSDFILEHESVVLAVQSGTGTVAVNGLLFPVLPGAICFFQSYHAFCFFPDQNAPLVVDALVMDYPLQIYLNFHVPNAREVEAWMDGPPVVHLCGAQRGKMQQLLDQIRQEDTAADPHSALVKVGLYGQIQVLFLQAAAAYDLQRFSAQQPLGWKAWTHLTKYCGNRLDAADIAAYFHVSVAQLNRELRKISGYDCRKLLARARAGISSAMLLFNNVSTQYISTSVGFSSENSFFRSFRDWNGSTPQEYRNRMLSADNHYPRQMINDKPFAVLNYISSNYRDNISLKTAAQKLYLSETVINQIMMECIGLPFYKIVAAYRLLHAEGLLTCTQMPVCDIALHLGFGSSHTFTRLFKGKYGLTPSEFRKRGRMK